MYVAFVGNLCPRINIPMKKQTFVCFFFIKILPNLLPTKLRPYETVKYWLSTNVDPHKNKVNPQNAIKELYDKAKKTFKKRFFMQKGRIFKSFIR